MTFIEKLSSLTIEQNEKLKTVKDAAGLEAFLSETDMELTQSEKAEVLDFIDSGKLPLSDEELEKVVAAGLPRPLQGVSYAQLQRPLPEPDYTNREQNPNRGEPYQGEQLQRPQ